MAAGSRPKPLIIALAVAVVAILAYWGFTAHKKRELDNTITASVQDASQRLRSALTVTVGPTEAITMQAGEFVLAGLGLQMNSEEQVLAVPAVPVHYMNGLRICGMWVMAARLRITSMSSRLRAMKAKIGEMSRPPRLGRKRRMGASSGSQI